MNRDRLIKELKKMPNIEVRFACHDNAEWEGDGIKTVTLVIKSEVDADCLPRSELNMLIDMPDEYIVIHG